MTVNWKIIVDVMLAVVFCAAVAVAIYSAHHAIFSPLPRQKGSETFIVLAASGRTEELQQAIGGLEWMNKSGKLDTQIIIADCGLDDYSRSLASLIMRDNGRITVCSPSELPRILEEHGWKDPENT